MADLTEVGAVALGEEPEPERQVRRNRGDLDPHLVDRGPPRQGTA